MRSFLNKVWSMGFFDFFWHINVQLPSALFFVFKGAVDFPCTFWFSKSLRKNSFLWVPAARNTKISSSLLVGPEGMWIQCKFSLSYYGNLEYCHVDPSPECPGKSAPFVEIWQKWPCASPQTRLPEALHASSLWSPPYPENKPRWGSQRMKDPGEDREASCPSHGQPRPFSHCSNTEEIQTGAAEWKLIQAFWENFVIHEPCL